VVGTQRKKTRTPRHEELARSSAATEAEFKIRDSGSKIQKSFRREY
jgi:hypothetical protein